MTGDLRLNLATTRRISWPSVRSPDTLLNKHRWRPSPILEDQCVASSPVRVWHGASAESPGTPCGCRNLTENRLKEETAREGAEWWDVQFSSHSDCKLQPALHLSAGVWTVLLRKTESALESSLKIFPPSGSQQTEAQMGDPAEKPMDHCRAAGGSSVLQPTRDYGDY